VNLASTKPESVEDREPSESVVLTDIEESVLGAAHHTRAKMANRYNKRFSAITFENNSIVALRIPKEDKGTLDLPRLYARVVDQPHEGRYQLQTQYGVLDWLYPTGELNRVSSIVGMFGF